MKYSTRKSDVDLKLGDCAAIRTGLVLSRKEAASDMEIYQYTALTLKALTETGTINHDTTELFNASVVLKRDYFTHKGDILLRLSAPYTAALVMEGDDGLLVSAHFSIIRAKRSLVDPTYLHWWLTQNRKRFYKVASGGSMMGTISSGFVGQMEIFLPPITEQIIIGNMLQLAYREQQLLTQLSEKKKLLVDKVLRDYSIPKS